MMLISTHDHAHFCYLSLVCASALGRMRSATQIDVGKKPAQISFISVAVALHHPRTRAHQFGHISELRNRQM
jgi:hypothetical protein